MSERRSTLELAVISAIAACSVDRSINVAMSTEVLAVLDSMGMLSALLEFQETLQLEFEPEAIIRILKCRRVGDIVAVLEDQALSGHESHA